MDSLPSVYILEIDKNVSIYIQNKFDNYLAEQCWYHILRNIQTYNVCMLVRPLNVPFSRVWILLSYNDLKRKLEDNVVIINVTYNKTDSQYIVKLSIITIDWLLSDREMYLGVCIGSCLSWVAAAALMSVHGRPELASWIFGCHKEL